MKNYGCLFNNVLKEDMSFDNKTKTRPETSTPLDNPIHDIKLHNRKKITLWFKLNICLPFHTFMEY